MFTGIVEAVGRIVHLQQDGGNIHFIIESPISKELSIDQSVSHDGVCLTVVKVEGNTHTVTAIAETLEKSSFKEKNIGDAINLERSMMMSERLDGHIVQGHVDETAICEGIKNENGSRLIRFKTYGLQNHLLVDKGSVAVNGVSLTVVKASKKKFSVAIIPYTAEHTNFRDLREGSVVNIEYDIIGKYVARILMNKKR